MDTLLLLLQCLLCGAAIAVAGFQLSAAGDRIAALTGLEAGWVGLVLLATVTSLPELAAGISAVTLFDAPDLAVGNVLGACLFNLLFLALVELLHRPGSIWQEASDSHRLPLAFALVMLGSVGLGLALGERAPGLWHVGLAAVLLPALYGVAVQAGYTPDAAAAPAAPGELRRELLRFAVAALVVLAAGSWLPGLADALVQATGWSRSAAGTLFMALVTTLPELAVTLAALRLRAVDLAIGNLLGSTLFNLSILAVDDLFYTPGALLAAASSAHLGSVAAAVLMSGLVLVGLTLRPRARLFGTVGWIGAGLLAAWAASGLAIVGR